MAARVTDKKRKQIIAEYAQVRSYRAVAKKFGLSANGVKKIVQSDPESAVKCAQKQEENTQDTLSYMAQQHDTKKRILGKLLAAIEAKADNVDMFTNVRDLATAYGILVDKELKFAELPIHSGKGSDLADDPMSASLLEIAGDLDAD